MRSNTFKLFLVIIAAAGLSISAHAADIPAAPELPVPAKVPYAFEPFGPGAVKPQGWLLDWAQSAAAGITGHLDEWSPVYGMGWKGVEFEARGAADEGQASGTEPLHDVIQVSQTRGEREVRSFLDALDFTKQFVSRHHHRSPRGQHVGRAFGGPW